MSNINWHKLSSTEQLETIDELSQQQPVIIFKHSTRCSISTMALSRLERSWDNNKGAGIAPYFLDLLNYREVSNQIASHYNIEHQSPQVLIIHQGKCTHDSSHMEISFDDVLGHIN